MKPALTPEEWKAPKVYWRQPDKYDEGCGIDMTDPLNGDWLWVFDGSWSVTLPTESRHAIAALALHGQPFGFTREDVTILLSEAEQNELDGFEDVGVILRSLAARIEALLPPEVK